MKRQTLKLRFGSFLLGCTAFAAAHTASEWLWPDTFDHPRLACAIASADGCVIWVNLARWERYRLAEAGS